MKILWFTNTPCSSSEKLTPGHNGGGWLSSLEQEISKQDKIQLHVAFYYTKKIDPFCHNNTWFYPIARKFSASKLHRYFGRLLMVGNNDSIEIKQLLSIVEQVKPDLIHIHGTEENFGLIQYHTQIPVVISIQGILSPIVEKFFSGIPAQIANKYNSLKCKLLLKSARYDFNNLEYKSIREREILKISKNIIGRTDWDKRVTRILAPDSEYFVGQEILRPSFYTNSWCKEQFGVKFKIVTILGNGVYKGFETIVKTAQVLCNYPNFNFEWSVIGLHKKSEIVLLVERWFEITSDNTNIKLMGEKNENEIVDLLLSADIYCQVSHIENSPNSLCEAMTLGVPTIGTFAGGTSSMLDNGNDGILVQDGDPYAFAGAIMEMSSDFERAILFGKNARTKAIKRHDKNFIFNNIIKTYESVIKK